MSGGDVAKVAIPMALTVASGGLAAPALAASAGISEALAGALTGAAAGAAGSAITGGDPLTGAALGGIGGGLTAPGGMTSIFGGGTDAAASGIGQAGADAAAQGATTAATDTAAQGAGNATATQGIGGFSGADNEIFSPSLASADSSLTTPTASEALQTKAAFATANPGTAMLNFAKEHPMGVLGSGLGGYMMNTGPQKQDVPLTRNNLTPSNVAPLQRTQTKIDPNAFYGVGGNRSGFVKANPSTVYLADGGHVQDKSAAQVNREKAMDLYARSKARDANFDGGDIDAYLNALDNGYKGTVDDYIGNIARAPQHFAKGGSALFQKFKGPSNFKQGAFHMADGGAAPNFSPSTNRLLQGLANGAAANSSFTPLSRIQSFFSNPDQNYGMDTPGGLGNLAKLVNAYRAPAQPAKYATGGHVMPNTAPTIPVPTQGLGSMVRGAGDGQSDAIPAMLSDGEYVIPAPVVSALGRGSNDAGAKKLDKMKKHIMAKTYKGGKPPASGLGSMRVA